MILRSRGRSASVALRLTASKPSLSAELQRARGFVSQRQQFTSLSEEVRYV